jgi:endonuclease/exonuclease/phosphatase family metal-dependent hydrolase
MKSTISSNAWTQIDIDSPDVVGIQIVGEQGTLRLINIYNDCEKDNTMEEVDSYMRGEGRRRNTRGPVRYVWLGDFNRHSPLWDKECNSHLFTKRNLEAADNLLDILARHGMQMALPAGIPTLKAMATGNLTRVDNVFCNENSLDIFVKCGTKPSHRPVKTDHFPVISTIRLTTMRNTFTPRYNFREVE